MNERKFFDIVKAIAIFGTVCAHGAAVPEDASVLNQIVSFLIACWGTSGVPIFYFLTGYFFAGNKRKWGAFWKNKGKTIVIPWIVCATLLWLYVVLRKGGISLAGWTKFVIGQGSTMYFVTVLLVMYALFFYIKNQITTIILCALSLLSIIGSCIGNNILNIWFGSAYLNPFNWLWYFGLGMLVYRMNLMEKFIAICKTVFPAATVLYIFLLYIHFQKSWAWEYWSRLALLNLTIQIIWCFGISAYILQWNKFSNHMAAIGMLSYTIYLCHQFLIGGLVKLTNLADFAVLTLLRPFIIIAVMYGGVVLARKLIGKYIPRLEWVFSIVGVREPGGRMDVLRNGAENE